VPNRNLCICGLCGILGFGIKSEGNNVPHYPNETRYQADGKQLEAVAARQGLVCCDPGVLLPGSQQVNKKPLRACPVAPADGTGGLSVFAVQDQVTCFIPINSVLTFLPMLSKEIIYSPDPRVR